MKPRTDDKLLTDEQLALIVEAIEQRTRTPYWELFAAIRQYVHEGSTAEALRSLALLEDRVNHQNRRGADTSAAAYGNQMRAIRHTGEILTALSAGAAPKVKAIQDYQREHGGRMLTPPTIRRALRDLHIYRPGKPGAPRKPKKSHKPK